MKFRTSVILTVILYFWVEGKTTHTKISFKSHQTFSFWSSDDIIEPDLKPKPIPKPTTKPTTTNLTTELIPKPKPEVTTKPTTETTTESIEAKSCITPNNKEGRCVSIELCPTLKSALYVIPGSIPVPEKDQYLSQATCDWITNETGFVRMVCCPRDQIEDLSLLSPVTITDNDIPILPDFNECGEPFKANHYDRIQGGFKVETNEQFPWIVALGYGDLYPDYKCSGSLISSHHVLTAAHCLVENLNNVKIGTINPYDQGQEGAIVGKYRHPEYNDTTAANDIAILKVAWRTKYKETLEYMDTPTQRRICLPFIPELENRTWEGFYPYIAGWGDEGFNVSSGNNLLRSAQVKVLEHEYCKKQYKGVLHATVDETIICAGYINTPIDACQGDSGGPLVIPVTFDNRPKFFQIGIISNGYKCALKAGLYTHIGLFKKWILETIKL